MECRRGDIYFVDFGRDTESSLQCGIRPALVVSNNRANENSPVITVIPLTARTYKRPHFPTHVLIPKTSGTGLARNSMGCSHFEIEQAVGDFHRRRQKQGTVTDLGIMEAVTKALQIQIGAVERYN